MVRHLTRGVSSTHNNSTSWAGSPIRVVVVDDHAVVRAGLRRILAPGAGFEVVGESDVRSMKTVLKGLEAVDVLFIEPVSADAKGDEVLQGVRELCPAARVIVLTSSCDRTRAEAAVAAGVSGYLLKDASPADVARAARGAVENAVHVDPRVTRVMLQPRRTSGKPDGAEVLTPRERQVVALIARGEANKSIGAQLGISERTARTHVSHVLKKLALSSRTQIALWARREGVASD